MDYKIYFRRFVALLLCCLLAIYTPLLPVAHAVDPATIAIAGGQIAGGGLGGAAAASSLAGPVGAIVGVTLGALGVGTYVSKTAADQGMTATEFVVLNIGKYCVAADIAKEKFYRRILDGCAVAADGAISLSNSAAQAIQQFGNWLFTQEDMVVPDVSSGDSLSVSLGDYSFPVSPFSLSFTRYLDSMPYESTIYTSSALPFAVCCYLTGSQYAGHETVGFLFFGLKTSITSNASFTVFQDFKGSTSTSSVKFDSYVGSFRYGTSTFGYISADSASIPVFPSRNDAISWLNSQSASWDVTAQEAHDQVFTGTPEAWAENKDMLNPSAEDDMPAAVLNPDVLNPIIDQLAAGTQWQMGITDYLKALEAAFDQAITGLGDKVVSLTDVVTGIKKEIAVPDDATKTADLTKPQVKPIDTPVVQPLEVNPDEAIDGISFQLDEVFPFCLPFDVYKMLGLLSADPVAPRYHVHYEGPYNIVIDFTVDLSAWDNVAVICRNMELLLFCVGLAVATRSIFIRA